MSGDTYAAYEAKEARFNQLRAELLPHNKTILFAALASAGIDAVTIEFDGASDEGCFQEPQAFSGDNAKIALPPIEITIKTVVFDTGLVEDATITVHDYLEKVSSDLLDEKHSYWEDGDGAFGEFRFTVLNQRISLEYNERYTASDHHEYEF